MSGGMSGGTGTARQTRQRRWAWGAAGVLLWSAGCANLDGPRQDPAHAAAPTSEVARCSSLYQLVDRTVSAAGVTDAQSHRLPGLPYLRISRFLAHGADAPDGPGFEAWVDRLRILDRQARRAELANLPDPPAPDWARSLDACAIVLRNHDLGASERRAALIAQRVPPSYQTWQRLVGLYPLTALPFLAGVRKLHAETRATFATPLDELPVSGQLRRYVPATDGRGLTPAQVAAILRNAAQGPLAIPDPGPDDLARLFRTFAPHWQIDVASAADIPGRPMLVDGRPPQVGGRATVFTHRSFARWRGRPVLQLNYVLWFPARPRQGPLDLVGGHLDGITWRVTLGMDGRPLLYDAMHNCGCYHLAFPTPRLTLSRARRGFEEPLLVAQQVPDGAGPTILRVSANSHYLQRVHRDEQAGGEQYLLADYQQLRSLPTPDGGRRSLFGPDGLVAGTERRERWLFWPMGVPEPGAMRQWGNHAIAFVGQRHFDDPDLLERYFEPVGNSGDGEDAAEM